MSSPNEEWGGDISPRRAISNHVVLVLGMGFWIMDDVAGEQEGEQATEYEEDTRQEQQLNRSSSTFRGRRVHGGAAPLGIVQC